MATVNDKQRSRVAASTPNRLHEIGGDRRLEECCLVGLWTAANLPPWIAPRDCILGTR
jgi:hypothetical protein